jgi:hypothetical protein
MKQIMVITAALLAGFIGGKGSTLVIRIREQGKPEQ